MYCVFSPVINDRYLEGKLFYLIFMHIYVILISKIRKTSLTSLIEFELHVFVDLVKLGMNEYNDIMFN